MRSEVLKIVSDGAVVVKRKNSAGIWVRRRRRLRSSDIGKNISAAQLRDLLAAINVTSNNDLPDGMRIVEDRIHRSRRCWHTRIGGILNAAFANSPAIVFTP